jgi:hypothetical protein
LLEHHSHPFKNSLKYSSGPPQKHRVTEVFSPHNYQKTEKFIYFFRKEFVIKSAEAARSYFSTCKNMVGVAAISK